MHDTAQLAMNAIGKALVVAERYGDWARTDHDAATWVIDQMVRELVGVDYDDWRAAYEADGSKWDEGVAP